MNYCFIVNRVFLPLLTHSSYGPIPGVETRRFAHVNLSSINREAFSTVMDLIKGFSAVT